MSKYWLKREQERLDILDSITDMHIKKLDKLMKDVANNLEREIFDLYVKYADDNNMTYAGTQLYLTNNERREFQKDLKYYIDTYKNKEKVIQQMKELQSLSVRARVKRIEKLKASIIKESNRLHEYLNVDTVSTFSKLYDESFLYKLYSMDQVGLALRFDLPGKHTIDTLLKYPWSGSNYSSKVWDKTEGFTSEIERVMTQGLIQGKSINAMVKDLRVSIYGKDSKKEGGQIFKYKRLVRTEASFIAEQATLSMYKRNNVEEYEYLATLDFKTSETCQRLDGKPFKVEDIKVGVNYPPMHQFCRSTTIPKIKWDGEEEDTGERMSRDPTTNKSKKPKDAPYSKWKENLNKMN